MTAPEKSAICPICGGPIDAEDTEDAIETKDGLVHGDCFGWRERAAGEGKGGAGAAVSGWVWAGCVAALVMLVAAGVFAYVHLVGGKSEGEKAEEVAVTYVTAVSDKKPGRVCALYSPRHLAGMTGQPLAAVQAEVEAGRISSMSESCLRHERAALRWAPGTSERWGLELPEARKAEVSGDQAKVEVVGAGNKSVLVELEEADGRWGISEEKTLRP